MNERLKNNGGKAALFGATIIWGASFIIVKSSMDVMQPFTLITLRFSIACLLLCVVFHRRLKKLNKDYFIKGGIIGIFLFLAYGLQTIGITDTTPGKNAFLTAVYCVIVPFLYWLVDKKKPDVFNIIAAFTSIAGIGLVSLNGDLTIRMGDAFTLAGGAIFAAHLIAIAKYSNDRDPILLTILQFGYCAIFSGIISVLFEKMPTRWTIEAVSGMLYLAVFATAVALLLQNIGQKYTKPAPAAIILSLESVFGVLLSVLFYQEKITLRLLIGFLFILVAVVISETKLEFLYKHKETQVVSEEI